MQYSIYAAGVFTALASIAMAENSPQNVCRPSDANGHVFGHAKAGPVFCAMISGHNKGNEAVQVPANRNGCAPIFCGDGVGIDLCPVGDGRPSVNWNDVANAIEGAYNECGGVTRADDGGWLDVQDRAYQLPIQPFQHNDKDWSVTVRGQDCSQAGYNSPAVQPRCY